MITKNKIIYVFLNFNQTYEIVILIYVKIKYLDLKTLIIIFKLFTLNFHITLI